MTAFSLGVALLSTLAAAESTTHLSEAQRSQLQKIIRGDVGKREVELVLAHFNENTTWSDPYAAVRTIYCKGSQVPGCVPLENVGREGHTYLHHIVANYDKLADWTVFSQAGPPSVGYNGHRLGGGHMQPGVHFHDYLLRDDGRDSYFVFTGALHLPSLFHVIRSSYLFPSAAPEDQLVGSAQCPNVQSTSDRWERLDLPKWFDDMMASKCGFPKGGLKAQLQQYWQDHVNSAMPEDGMVFFSQGARFAVSRERLHQRSLEEYKDLLSLVSESNDPCANYMNEWLWYYIMGKAQKAPCAAQDVDIEAPVSAAVRFLSGVSGVSGDASTSSTSSTGSGASTGSASSTSSGNSTGSSNSSNSTSGGDSTSDKQASGAPSLSAMWIMAVAAAFAFWQ